MPTRWAGFVASSRILDVVAIVLTLGIAVAAILRSRLFEATPFSLAVVALACLAIPWRQRFPELTLAIALTALLVASQPVPVMLAAGNFTAAYGTGRRTWIMLVLTSIPVLMGIGIEGFGRAGLGLIWGSVILLPATVGLYLNSRHLAVEAANERADQIAAAQHALAEAARRDERTRIAREMHDVVAHQVSLIALYAGALEVTAEGTPAAESAQMIRQTARQALEELRNVVGVLRTEDDAPPSDRPSRPPARWGAWCSSGATPGWT